MLKFLYVIYSLFVITLALLVFNGNIYLEQYNMYFICFCLCIPIFISLLNKFEVIKIGSFLELSKKLDFIEKQQNLLFKQVSVMTNKVEVNVFAKREKATEEEIKAQENDLKEKDFDKKSEEIKDPKKSIKNFSYWNEIKIENTILKYFLKNKPSNYVDFTPQSISFSKGSENIRKVYFDAYFKEYNAEGFVEVKATTFNPTLIEKIREQLNAIKIYNEANNKNACLILLLVDLRNYDKKVTDEIISKLKLDMDYYLQQNLLYIEHYNYNIVNTILNKEDN